MPRHGTCKVISAYVRIFFGGFSVLLQNIEETITYFKSKDYNVVVMKYIHVFAGAMEVAIA